MVKRKGGKRQVEPMEDVLSDASSDLGLDMIGGDDERNDFSDLEGDEEVDVMSIGSQDDAQEEVAEAFAEEEEGKADDTDDRLAWGKRDRDFYGSESEDESSEAEELQLEEAKKAALSRAKLLPKKTAELVEELAGDEGVHTEASTEEKTAASEGEDSEDDADDFDFAVGDISFKGPAVAPKKLKGGLSQSERRRLALKESPELEALVQQYREGALNLADEARDLVDAVRKMPPPAGKGGMTFVEAKLQLLLSYLSYLSYYFMLKAKGGSVRKHPVIGKIASTKAMLERLTPIEEGVQDQIEELLSRAATAEADADMGYLDEVLTRLGVNMAVPEDEEIDGSEGESEDGEEGVEEEEGEVSVKVSKADLVKLLGKSKPEKAVNGDQLDQENILAKMAARDDEEDAAELMLQPKMKTSKKSLGKLRAKVKGGKGYAGAGSVSLDEVAEVEDLVDRRTALADILNSAKQVEEAASGRKAGGDDDVEIRKGMSMRDIRAAMEEEEERAAEVPNNDGEDEGEMEPSLMRKARKNREAKRVAKKSALASKARAFMPEEENEVDLRSTNYAINKNKGLTRKRKKEDRNARVKNRNRYERALKRRKGAVQEVREGNADGTYSGEATGLRTNVKKSVKLG
ncbi:utp3, small subunit (SSU) processome component [Perkinsus chesapeaki]|uniref:Utp3, small subunit (SSU) processome component n=1 Tax=Perkinsus chesapeaki TaxID=330153 RepID=A0A7J6MRC8_PERCH|nr:utp3, small subunit (SSU) processome component [Perkinsus chesapeaki]